MDGIEVRSARPEDVDALADLRLENAHVHVVLDPSVYRVPDRAAVKHHFAESVGSTEGGWLAVAEVEGRVVGMVEVLPAAEPPEHQILLPTTSAHVHSVVLLGHRRRGVGRALLAAAEQWALQHGVEHLVAGIHASNTAGLSFYEKRGYRSNGDVRLKDLGDRT